MSKRSEEEALKAYPKEDIKMWHCAFGTFEFDKNAGARKAYQEGYEQAEKDLREEVASCKAKVWSDGYEQGLKELRWISVNESLPPCDEEVIVLSDNIHGESVKGVNYICFGHIVDKRCAVNYNGWNIPGVHHWMPCPKIPEE